MQPKISVVMSVYNAADTVGEAVRSILAQTFTDFEFIIVNDGSTDGTREILAGFTDDRIRIIDQPNRGLTVSLNRAIGEASGEYIARQDSDDVSLPDRLERQVEFLDSTPRAAVVGCRGRWIDESGRTSAPLPIKCHPGEVREELQTKNALIHGSCMIRKSAFDEIGGYREQFRCAQDYDLWLRISEKHDLANIPESLYLFRMGVGKISVKKGIEQDTFRELARIFAEQRRVRGHDMLNSLSPEKAAAAVANFLEKSQTSWTRLLVKKHLEWAEAEYWNGDWKGMFRFTLLAVKADPLYSPWLRFIIGFVAPTSLNRALSFVKSKVSSDHRDS